MELSITTMPLQKEADSRAAKHAAESCCSKVNLTALRQGRYSWVSHWPYLNWSCWSYGFLMPRGAIPLLVSQLSCDLSHFMNCGADLGTYQQHVVGPNVEREGIVHLWNGTFSEIAQPARWPHTDLIRSQVAETNQPNISTDTKGISETRDNADSRKQRGCVRPVLQDVVSLNLITELFYRNWAWFRWREATWIQNSRWWTHRSSNYQLPNVTFKESDICECLALAR